MKCRICDTKCKQFLDLGKQPIANNFLESDQFGSELYYHLTVHFCPSCFVIQLGETPDMTKVFNQNYAFYTGSSQVMTQHFKDLATKIERAYLEPIRREDRRPVVVEIGANDGTLLQNFIDPDNEREQPLVMGFEPSKSVADIAIKKGVRITTTPFEKHQFPGVGNWPETDVIVSANTFAHIPDRQGVLKNIQKILSPTGVWINEEPYFGKVIKRLAFDQIYNEHVFYTSIMSMSTALSGYGMYIDSFEFLQTHGGSIRYYIKKGSDDRATAQAFVYRCLSDTFEMNTMDHLTRFSSDVKQRIQALKFQVAEIGKPIIGYGAPAKMATITNCCGFGPDQIKKVYDTTPSKVGKFSPGSHIPVVSMDGFDKDRTRNVFLFIWNHKGEVIGKEKKKGINWIYPVSDTDQL